MLTQSKIRFIKPAAPVLVEVPPAGPGWIHEIKQDGYRTEILIEDGAARAFSRSGLDWSDKYRPVLEAALKTGGRSALLDGEMIAPDERGVSDFGALQKAISRWPDRLVFVAFDLLRLDGEDIRSRPIEDRRRLLRELVDRASDPHLVFSEGFAAEGAEVFALADRMGLEGIVSKRAGSPYRSGPASGWQKAKTFVTGEFNVIGVDKTPGGAPVMLLATQGGDGGATYAGNAFIALKGELRDAFWRYVDENRADASPINGLRRKGANWLRPGLTATVRYLRGEGMLRHASVSEARIG